MKRAYRQTRRRRPTPPPPSPPPLPPCRATAESRLSIARTIFTHKKHIDSAAIGRAFAIIQIDRRWCFVVYSQCGLVYTHEFEPFDYTDKWFAGWLTGCCCHCCCCRCYCTIYNVYGKTIYFVRFMQYTSIKRDTHKSIN